MKRLLPILMGLAVLLGMQQAQAFDPEHLKRLKETNSCPNCDLQGANLYRAYLQGANLKGANLKGANLKGANLYGAKLDPEDIKIAKATGAINVPEPVVVVKKPSPSVIGTAEKTPKIKPKRNVSQAPSIIGTSEKTPKVTPKRKPSVVAKVTPKKTEPEPPAQSISASGFFVSKLGHVITNEHVVRNCKSVTVGDNANKQSPANIGGIL